MTTTAMCLPPKMRKPRNARGGWFYINPASVDIIAPPSGNGIVTVTRRQLVAALKVMDKYVPMKGTSPP